MIILRGWITKAGDGLWTGTLPSLSITKTREKKGLCLSSIRIEAENKFYELFDLLCAARLVDLNTGEFDIKFEGLSDEKYIEKALIGFDYKDYLK